MPTFKMRYLLIALVPLAVAGCVSSEDQRAMDQDKCSSFGFQPRTDAFANCMMKQSTQRDEDDRRLEDRVNEQEQWDRDRKRRHKHHKNRGDVDYRPQYDKDGNPNFDTKGNYQGCHGIGCEVDNPDD